MHKVTLTNLVLTILIAICSAASLTDEDIAKILDGTTGGDGMANLGEYETDLQLGNLRDKLRTLENLKTANTDLYPAQDPEILSDAVQSNRPQKTFGDESNGVSRDMGNIALSTFISRLAGQSGDARRNNGVVDGNSWDTFLTSGLSSTDFYKNKMDNGNVLNGIFHKNEAIDNDQLGHKADKDLEDLSDQPFSKRNLFCNRRSGCGRKRGKRQRTNSDIFGPFCHQLKCESKRVLCNRGGCRSKRLDNMISEMYCGTFSCSTQGDYVDDSPVGVTMSSPTKDDDIDPLIYDNRQDLIGEGISNTLSNDVDETHGTDSRYRRFLIELIKKSLFRQKNTAMVHKLRTMICTTYNLCETRGQTSITD